MCYHTEGVEGPQIVGFNCEQMTGEFIDTDIIKLKLFRAETNSGPKGYFIRNT